jgi:hypothetical protein
MNCLLVPTLAQDLSLLERLADSIDYPIKYKRVINNGKIGALDKWKLSHTDWKVFETVMGSNLGVAKSWNLSYEVFFGREYSCLIVNDDFEFQSGQLEKLCKAADEHPEAPTVHLTASEGYNCFVWNRWGFEQIGLFDENYWPAYFEDYDYRLRMRLLGLTPFIVGLQDSEIKHGKPYSGGQRYRKFLDEADVLQRDYYTRKWGSVTDVPHGTFKHPFNNENNKVDFWKVEPELRVTLQKLWDKFSSVENYLRTDVCD